MNDLPVKRRRRRSRGKVQFSRGVLSPPRRKRAEPQAADIESSDTKDSTDSKDDKMAAAKDEEKPSDQTVGFESDDIDTLGVGSPFVFDSDLDESNLFSADQVEALKQEVSPASEPSVEARIRELESRIAGLSAAHPLDNLDSDLDVDAGSEPSSESTGPNSAESAIDAARELLESDYYRTKLGRSSLRERSLETDDFGLDPAYEAKLRPLLEFLFKRYFRVSVEGMENVPKEGRGVVVANHSGTLPFDGAMLREAVRLHHTGSRDLRWLAEDFSFYLPFIGVTMNRIGAVRACQENAIRLLSKNHLIAAFPEGAEGLKKKFSDRYRLQRFGRGGFVRLCLKTNSPIIPCAIIGAEESSPILYRLDNLSKLVGLDYLPITPTFPAFGPLGLLPAPTKWKMVFGEPISVEQYGPEAAYDHVLVGKLSEQVRSEIDRLVQKSLKRRRSIWL